MSIKDVTQELRRKNLGEFAEEIERVISMRKKESGYRSCQGSYSLAKTVDVQKIDVEEEGDKGETYSTHVQYILKLLKQYTPEKTPNKTKIDPENLTGKMYILGLGYVTFSIGDENLYVKIDEVMVKNSPEKLIVSLIELGKVINKD